MFSPDTMPPAGWISGPRCKFRAKTSAFYIAPRDNYDHRVRWGKLADLIANAAFLKAADECTLAFFATFYRDQSSGDTSPSEAQWRTDDGNG
jgi:hypothetical protein